MSITEKLAVTYERKVDMHFCQFFDNDNDNDNDNTFIEHKYRLQIRIYI